MPLTELFLNYCMLMKKNFGKAEEAFSPLGGRATDERVSAKEVPAMALPLTERAMDERERAKERSAMAIPMTERAMDGRERANKMPAIALPMTERAMDERERAMEIVKKAVLPQASRRFVLKAQHLSP
jgi:hypothetical protein